MTFQPVLPLTGYTGWRFLQRTLTTQQEAFESSPLLKREAAYFRDNIAQVKRPEDLVSDRQLLKVALGAFGLDGDIDSKYFIERILGDGTTDDGALANKLADKRYADFSKAFGFDGIFGPRTGRTGFADEILERYNGKQFQLAVGEVNGDMRLALNVKEGLEDVVAKGSTDTSQWYHIMGNPPLRTVFETALGMPSGFGALDIDLQLSQFQDRSRSVFGTDQIKDFATPNKQEDLIRMFLIRSEAKQFNASANSGQIAITLLSSMRNPWKQA